MRSLAWTEGAIADLDHIHQYVAAFDPAAAGRLARRIALVAERVQREEAPGGIVEWSIVSPFLLRFRIAPDGAIVHAVRHSNRALIR